ncbi:MAG: excinuclease ABC subunit C domain-containing protein [Candidatus Peregrinibacteria bacterium Greene0416_62]|nr:MAG: excinuclease ABC subunit C domain-containing protein [Candidatus Peregrinibacteria bacterium Greene0416_62]TSC99594.1 MAG: excinuclease ABC subunit C domain-containing protein [Candidatus Peregrinibacteria bacterium Greene1014_49]
MWHYVYVLENNQGRQYVGSTRDVKKRLAKHNKGDVPHTSKFCPWELRFACVFPTTEQALIFEKYLKSGSGTMFRYRHLVPNERNVIGTSHVV